MFLISANLTDNYSRHVITTKQTIQKGSFLFWSPDTLSLVGRSYHELFPVILEVAHRNRVINNFVFGLWIEHYDSLVFRHYAAEMISKHISRRSSRFMDNDCLELSSPLRPATSFSESSNP